MCQLPPKKKQILKRKSQKAKQFFMTPTASEKIQNLPHLASKKPIWQPCCKLLQKVFLKRT